MRGNRTRRGYWASWKPARLVLCHAYKLGLTEGQEVVGAKRGGKCIGIYIDDERQSSRPPGPRPAGLAANAPSAASPRFKGSMDPVFTAASCIWSVCRQSTLICRRDRALEVPPALRYTGAAITQAHRLGRERLPLAKLMRRVPQSPALAAQGQFKSQENGTQSCQ